MKKIAIILATAASIAMVSTSAFAWGTSDCGCYHDPKPTKQRKVNSGVGNGAENGPYEYNDEDPGNSGANNQAGKNTFKPASQRR